MKCRTQLIHTPTEHYLTNYMIYYYQYISHLLILKKFSKKLLQYKNSIEKKFLLNFESKDAECE